MANEEPGWRYQWWPIAVIGLLTLLGLALRLHQYGMSLLGDEMSTLWLVGNPDSNMFHAISSDAEISPPLYFILAKVSWVFFGPAAEVIRLPALIAGTACVPLTYLLGLRTVGRIPGLIAAGLMAISPFMIFFSGSGRGYTLMIALLIGSTLAMLAAARGGGLRWWVAYALLSSLAVYTHYTAVFVLGAQFLWLLWAEPGCRRPALFANLGAAALFLPWLPSFIADTDSPTTELLEALQGDGFETKRLAVEQWIFGHPLLTPSQLPGRGALIVITLAVVLAAVVSLVRVLGRKTGFRTWLGDNRLAVLVFAIALATPAAELVLALAGTDLFGSRNLVASTPGVLLAIGTVLTAAGPVWGGICGLAVIGGFAVGTVKSLEDSAATIDYRSAAAQIGREGETNDRVIDLLSPPITPVPLTPLAAEPELDTFDIESINLPAGEPPFLPLTPVPDPDRRLNSALNDGRDRHVFIVGPRADVTVGTGDKGKYLDGNIELPRGWKVDSVTTYPGVADLNVYKVSRPGGRAGGSR